MNDFDVIDDILDGVSDTISFARSHRRDPILHRRRGRRRRPFFLFRFLRRKP